MPTVIGGFQSVVIDEFNKLTAGENWTNGQIRAKTDKGQGPFDDRLSVLCYCIGYMYRHYDDLKAILAREAFALPQENSRILIIDLGCGPGTAGIAIRDYFRGNLAVPIIDYYGMDRSIEMTNMASLLFDRMSGGFRGTKAFFKSTENALTYIKQKAARQYTTCIFCASYLLSQKSLSDDDVGALASLITAIAEQYPGTPGVFISANIDTGKAYRMPDQLPLLIELCSERGIRIPQIIKKYTPRTTRTPMLLRQDGFFDDPWKEDNAVCYVLGSIERAGNDAATPSE